MEIPYIDIHTHKIINPQNVISLHSELWSRERECGSVSVKISKGVHPWDASKITPQELQEFFADRSGVAAIGECGFDFAHGRGNFEDQKSVFSYQITKSVELSLPIIIHSVKASAEVILALRGQSMEGVIIHGFTGSHQQAEAYLGEGYYISFGPSMLRSPKTQQALRAMPLDRVFLETDDSEMPIEEIYKFVSDLLKVNLEELKQKIAKNYERVVGTL